MKLVMKHDTANCLDHKGKVVSLTRIRFEDQHEDVEFFARLYEHLEQSFDMFVDYEDEVSIFGLHELDAINQSLKTFTG